MKKGKGIIERSNFREEVAVQPRSTDSKTNSLTLTRNQVFHINSNVIYGIDEEENTELQIDERKRRRSEMHGDQMDILMGQNANGLQTDIINQGVVISGGDLTAPSQIVLAELARQASHLQ